MSAARKAKWPILAGMLAGAVGAIVAALVSLPLRSPDDLIANSASVAIVALLVGLAGGFLWRGLATRAGARKRMRTFAGVGFAGAVAILLVLEVVALDRFVSFGVPLAAIIFAAVGYLTPVFAEMALPTWVPLVGVIAALAVGGGLASFGDAESGDLSLDDLPVLTVPPASTVAGSTTAAPATTVATGGSSEPGVLDRLAATSFSFSGGTATWSVPETFASNGLNATAVGRSESLQGTVELTGISQFTVDLTTFVSDQDRRDNRVRQQFAADPIATFTTTELQLPDFYTEGDVFATEVAGELTINSVTRAVTWSIEARIVGSQLDVTGELDIVLTDFDVIPPSIGGFVTVEDSARLEVLFSATG